jgi:hypothetical protein
MVDEVVTINEETNCRVAVVGGGAAAIAAVSALVETETPLLWFCGGSAPTPFDLNFTNISVFRQTHANAWQDLVGDGIEIKELVQPTSPKNRIKRFRADTAGYASSSKLIANDFHLIGTLVQGGLTNFWGAEIQLFDEADMPLPDEAWRELRLSYRRIADLVPISGVLNHGQNALDWSGLVSHPPMPLPASVRRILAFCESAPTQGECAYTAVRPSLLAVRTARSFDGGACTLCGGCLWGCKEGAIFSAAHKMGSLSANRRVQFDPGWFVEQIRRHNHGFLLTLRAPESQTMKTVRVDRVLLAAGAPVSTRLAFDCAGLYDEWFHFGHTFGFAFAMLVPRFLGSVLPDVGHAMAVLNWEVSGRNLLNRVGGSFYLPTGLPDSEVIRFMPFTRPGAVAIWKHLRGAILIGHGFLSSEFSQTSVRIRRSDRHLEFRTETSESAPAEVAKAIKILRRRLRRAGAIIVPASLKMMPAGADFHYGASLPHLGKSRNATDILGQLHGLEGLHVIDGAVLPRLPSRHPTFTVMANADRIARAVRAYL